PRQFRTEQRNLLGQDADSRCGSVVEAGFLVAASRKCWNRRDEPGFLQECADIPHRVRHVPDGGTHSCAEADRSIQHDRTGAIQRSGWRQPDGRCRRDAVRNDYIRGDNAIVDRYAQRRCKRTSVHLTHNRSQPWCIRTDAAGFLEDAVSHGRTPRREEFQLRQLVRRQLRATLWSQRGSCSRACHGEAEGGVWESDSRAVIRCAPGGVPDQCHVWHITVTDCCTATRTRIPGWYRRRSGTLLLRARKPPDHAL